MSASLQAEMQLSAGDSILHMVGNSKYKLACAINESEWYQEMKNVPEAVEWANNVAGAGMSDCYVSQNTFLPNRNNTNIRELTALFVDLDYYHTEYKNLEPIELWQVIKAELPWIPEPSRIVDSGRGAYLIWDFERPLPVNRKTEKYNWPAQWQICEDFLVKSLKPFGVDSCASDMARVLRVPDTINSKNGARAKCFTTGNKYDFVELKEIFNAVYRSQREEQKKVIPKHRQNKKLNTKPYRKLERLFNWFSLARARTKDIERLASLRGGRLTDNRRKAIFVYAVESCHYCRSEESLRNEIEGFVNSYIAEPEKYNPYTNSHVNIKEVLRRFREQEARGHFQWLENHSANRYRLTTQYIIDSLGVTATEARSMKALVSKEEKYTRRVKKRREAGVREQVEYTNEVKKAAQRRIQEARRLFSEGMSKSAIAKKLGISRQSVYNYLKV